MMEAKSTCRESQAAPVQTGYDQPSVCTSGAAWKDERHLGKRVKKDVLVEAGTGAAAWGRHFKAGVAEVDRKWRSRRINDEMAPQAERARSAFSLIDCSPEQITS